MNAESSKKVKRIFGEALERPPDGRASFLDSACRGDLDLRQRVDGMLVDLEAAEGFMSAPTRADQPGAGTNGPGRAIGVAESNSEHEKAGAMIGRYKLLQLIGEGGFGAVYMAEQREPVKRKVALKIIKLGMDTKQVIARFEAERQALAIMDHINIARVLDAGATENGRPYFVMELVRGVPITEYCDRENLAPRQRLELFMQVCNAVQHAHQKGIIHRDIKPSNVMLTLHDGVPIPKVIDFGIAKATGAELTEKTLFTRYEQMIGTPAYMSPEQAEMSGLDIDTRSDIYSLGVLLYELLTGTTPFDATELRNAGYAEIQRIIREVEPPRPSTRVSSLQSEPCTQVRRSSPSEPEAQARDSSAIASNTLAGASGSDSGLPPLVPRAPIPDPSSAITIARHRRTDPSSLSKLLRGDLDWIVMKALEKDRSRRYASASDFAGDVQRHLRDEPVLASPPSRIYRLVKFVRRNHVGVTAGGFVAAALMIGLTLSTIGFVQASRGRVRAREAETAAKQEARKAAEVSGFLQEMLASLDPEEAKGRQISVRFLLDEAGKKIEDGSLAGQPEVESDVRLTLGRTYFALGLFRPAESQLRRALELSRQVHGDEHVRVAECLHALGEMLLHRSELLAADPLLRDALAIRRKLLGDRHAATAETLSVLALVVRCSGNRVEAESLYRESLEIRRDLPRENDPALADTLRSLARLLRERGDYAGAETLLHEAVIEQKLPSDDPTLIAEQLSKEAYALKKKGDYRSAEARFLESLEVYRKHFGQSHPHLIKAQARLGWLYYDMSDYDAAEAIFRETAALARKIYGDYSLAVMHRLRNLISALQAKEDFAAAHDVLTEVLAIGRKVLNGNHPTAWALSGLAGVLRDEDSAALAEPLYREALAIDRARLRNDHLLLGLSVTNLARVLKRQRKYDEAEALLSEALTLRRRALGDQHPDTLKSIGQLAGLYVAQKHYAAAELLLRELLEIRRKAYAHDQEALAGTLLALGYDLLQEQRFAEAEPFLRECLAIREDKMPRYWLRFNAMSLLGGALLGQGKFGEAEPLLLDGYVGMEKKPRATAKCKSEAAQRIVELYEASGEIDKADEWRGKLGSERDK